ncbi:MAG: hypothetical protein ACKVH0_07850 [Alphaproteobacteria bacterium]
MSALGHYLEAAGIPTAGVSLVRENTEQMRPPRALWTPFPLGRPFGAPDEPQFQTTVLRAVLALFDRQDGPVILEDFPEDAPDQGATNDMDGMVCPIPLRRPPVDATPEPLRSVLAEIAQLAPWHAHFVENHGRSIATVSKLSIEDVAKRLHDVLTTSSADGLSGKPLGTLVRFATEDLRNWHIEAASARPGGAASADRLADWFWGETSAGAMTLALHPVCLASEDTILRHVGAKQLIPRVQQHRL